MFDEIEIGVDRFGNPYVESKRENDFEPVELTPAEENAVNAVIDAVKEDGMDPREIHLERRTDEYVSVVLYDVQDFCRIKAGEGENWISLSFSPEDRKALRSDGRFQALSEKDRKKSRWKITLSQPEDISQHLDLVRKSCRAIMLEHR